MFDRDDVSEQVEKVRDSGWLGKLAMSLVVAIVLAFIGLLAFRALCVDFVDNYKLAYTFDKRGGKITRLYSYETRNGKTVRVNKTGYIVTPPFLVKVHSVDLRPMQVCINANQRVLNCKLVQFNPEGVDQTTGLNSLDLFLSWHGRDDYDAPSSSSSSTSGGTGTTPFSEILKSYAYEGSGKSYPFLTVIRELGSNELANPIAPQVPVSQPAPAQPAPAEQERK